ncbi:hypothetical protein LJD42_28655, partial [Escherichia coli]|nr:hypothetical protein [Escherichia coli]
ARDHLLAEAMRPAETSEAWSAINRESNAFSAAVAPVALIEAANEREEALAVAIALRDAIEAPDKTAALITADRDLARRVAS